MAWPDVEKLVRVLDISRWVGDGENSPLIDFQELKAKRPDVKAIICRMAVGDYYKDVAFEHNYNKGLEAGFYMGIYYPLNPASKISSAKQFFRSCLGDKRPPVIVPDCELRGGKPNKEIVSYTQDFFKWLLDSYSAKLLNYTAAWFWNPIFQNGWGNEVDLWTAYYPLWWSRTNGSKRQARSFEEIESLLPLNLDNAPIPTHHKKHLKEIPVVPTPWIGHPEKVKAWQFSGKGELPPLTGPTPKSKSTDLNLWKKDYFESVFGPIQDEEEKTLIELKVDPTKVKVKINGQYYDLT